MHQLPDKFWKASVAVWGQAYLCSVWKLFSRRLRFPDNHCFCHQHVGVLLLGLLYRHSKGLQGTWSVKIHTTFLAFCNFHSSHLMLVHVVIPCYYNPFLNSSLWVASFHSLRNKKINKSKNNSLQNITIVSAIKKKKTKLHQHWCFCSQHIILSKNLLLAEGNVWNELVFFFLKGQRLTILLFY